MSSFSSPHPDQGKKEEQDKAVELLLAEVHFAKEPREEAI